MEKGKTVARFELVIESDLDLQGIIAIKIELFAPKPGIHYILSSFLIT